MPFEEMKVPGMKEKLMEQHAQTIQPGKNTSAYEVVYVIADSNLQPYLLFQHLLH